MNLKLGDTIHVDGMEFIITYLSHAHDTEGRGIRIDGLDPFRAQMHIEKQRKSKEAIELGIQVAKQALE